MRYHSRSLSDSATGTADASAKVGRARIAQARWRDLPVRERLRVVGRFRRALAESALEAARVAAGRRRPVDVLPSEVLPLADACRFLESRAADLLAPRRLGRRGRPAWLRGSDVEILREPFGVVLVAGPANYPLMLPGIHALQALAAGNAVLLKPGTGGRPSAALLERLLSGAGLPEGLLTVLDETVAAFDAAVDAGVDLVVLTGSSSTGRAVLDRLAGKLTPSVMELSGCDACFVLEDADLELAAKALAFGSRLNGGFTCIAPRRVFVARSKAAELEKLLAEYSDRAGSMSVGIHSEKLVVSVVGDALAAGARIAAGRLPEGGKMPTLVLADATPEMAVMSADLAAPVISLCPVKDEEHALSLASRCPYELGATVFASEGRARSLASRLTAGVVVINDMIVPTADPRIPFGGRGESGFGVTRGAEGLLSLTRPRSVATRRGRFRPHFDPSTDTDERLFAAWLRAAHGSGLGARAAAVLTLIRSLAGRRPGASSSGDSTIGQSADRRKAAHRATRDPDADSPLAAPRTSGSEKKWS
jgi:acyl-CoA reductase-like NAD-dependent aldehyde dehydrogenase